MINVFSIIFSLYAGFVLRTVFDKHSNKESIIRNSNRELSKKVMSGRDYLVALKKLSGFTDEDILINELDRIFVVRKWLDKKAKFTIIEEKSYTVSADFESFHDFKMK